jgi:signal transduction histidine kinase
MKSLTAFTGYVNPRNLLLTFFIFAVGGALLFVLSYYNFLLFHTLAELFSIIIAAAIFIIAWNTRQYAENNSLLFLGITYLFVGVLDLFHTLTYKDLNLFGAKVFYATEFWVAARYMESISILMYSLFFERLKIRYYGVIIALYAAAAAAVILSILVWKIFPVAYIDLPGKGLTPFKIISEYIIIGILAAGVLILLLKRRRLKPRLLFYFVLFIITTIISEFFFTLYVDVFGIWNFLGHILKIISFYLVYKSIIQYSLKNPFELIFNELKQQELKLKEANATKDKFFSIIAHDLKGPFSGIMGFSKLLSEKYNDITEENKKYFIGLIHNSSEQAFNLLENLLNWARVQSDKLKVQKVKVDLGKVIGDIIALFANYAETKQIVLESEMEGNITVSVDKSMIFTVISNLVNNGLKYTMPGGRVTVQAARDNNNMEVKVIDTGVGIKEENREKLFRIDTTYIKPGTNHENGTGLGLILCKEFIELHHGRIWVESVYGKGSTFAFSIPV